MKVDGSVAAEQFALPFIMLRIQLRILCVVALLGIVSAQDSQLDRSVTLWLWPFSDKAPHELAHISYNANTSASSVNKYIPPRTLPSSDDLIRVGLYDSKTSRWNGILTSGVAFDTRYRRQAELFVDENGETYHIGFSAFPRPELSKKARKSRSRKNARATAKQGAKKDKAQHEAEEAALEKEQIPLSVEISRPLPGPTPHLNKPVVVSPDGKVESQEQEKTFLQM